MSTDTAGYWNVAEKLKQVGKTLILSDRTLRLMTTSHRTLSGVDVACSYRHATLDIALVTCGPSCPTASWWAHAKGKTVCGFPSVSPWTSETVQWKLSMLQLICCRCSGELSERSFCQDITWGFQEKTHNSWKMWCQGNVENPVSQMWHW